jgi:peptidoglycan/LPS O-acetylase OafA/YrhL
MGGDHRGRRHAPWLDGIRGLSALVVALHHAVLEVEAGGLPAWASHAVGWLRDAGRPAVAVFIVLSGYSLMLPVARDGVIRGGVGGYLLRRARRILPPYYAALIVCLLLIHAVPLLQARNGNGRWDQALPATGPGVLASHLLLVHNLRSDWISRIDPPLWSVATEWQIYFLFPVLVAVWKGWGRAALLVASAVPALVARGAMDADSFRSMSPWYATLFAIGMVAACPRRSDPARATPAIAVAGTLLALALSGAQARADVLCALAVVALMAYCTAAPSGSLALRILESRAAVGLGAYSYSLYLIHMPAQAIVSNWMIARGWDASARLAAMLAVATPLSLAASYAFHLAFERPLLSPRTGSGARREALAVASSAP